MGLCHQLLTRAVEVRSLDTAFRSAMVSGDLHLVAIPLCHFAPASVHATRGVTLFLWISGKYGSNLLQMPERYESTDLGLM